MATTGEKTLVLGIETSCDETAVAIIDSEKHILSNIVRSQFEKHQAYGGVVPEIAARAHVEILDTLLKEAILEANIEWHDLDAIATTMGPGLIGGLMVGAVTGKALALSLNIPFLPINHLAAHALSPRLVETVPYPYLLLLVSGGHCQILDVQGPKAFKRLGTTIDDAAGEAFDKTAKLLGLGMPGGPEIETWAKKGREDRFSFPRPMKNSNTLDFSFSGLKTAILHTAESLADQNNRLKPEDIADIAAGFQAAISDVLTAKTAQAMQAYKKTYKDKPLHFVVAGGVAANQKLREALESAAQKSGFFFHAPPLWLCGDNAAMVGWAGQEFLAVGEKGDLSAPTRARWPLDESQTPKIGHGKRGVKV